MICSFTFLAENEINTLLLHFISFISFINNLDTNYIPWSERGGALHKVQLFPDESNMSRVIILKL